jgi:hypothetical protein
MLGTIWLTQRFSDREVVLRLSVLTPGPAATAQVGSDRLAVLADALRRAWPEDTTPCFPQMLLEVDEAEWQSKLSRITIHCDCRVH